MSHLCVAVSGRIGGRHVEVPRKEVFRGLFVAVLNVKFPHPLTFQVTTATHAHVLPSGMRLTREQRGLENRAAHLCGLFWINKYYKRIFSPDFLNSFLSLPYCENTV